MDDFDTLIGRLSEKAERTPQMVEAMVELTYGCNLRCVHCYNPTHEARDELTTAQICGLLDQLATEGCLWVGFTGGELFTRRDAFEILRYAKSLGMVLTVVTNATLVTDALADQIAAIDPFQVDISVYGASAATYEAVTRRAGSFAQFERGIERLRTRDVRIMLKLILMSLNIHEFSKMKMFAQSRQLPFVVATDIVPKVDGSKEPLAYRLTPEDSFNVWRDLESGAITMPAQCGSEGRLFDCKCGRTNAAFTPYGRMNLCTSIQFPRVDVTRETVAAGWKQLVGTVRSSSSGPDYECGRCAISVHCARGASDGWLEQGRFDAPCIDYYREIAELKANYLAGRTESRTEAFTV